MFNTTHVQMNPTHWHQHFQPVKLLHLHKFPSTCQLLEAAVKSLHMWIHIESTAVLGTWRGAGKAEQWAKDPDRQAFVIHKKKEKKKSQWLFVLIFRSSQLTVSSKNQIEGMMQKAEGDESQRLIIDNTIHSSNSYCFRGKLDWGGSWAEKAESRQGGLWYVRNAAKANRKPPHSCV